VVHFPPVAFDLVSFNQPLWPKNNLPSKAVEGTDQALDRPGAIRARAVVNSRRIYSLTRIFVYDDIWSMTPDTLAALGEPNRFRIVELLRTGPRSVNDIRGRLGLRQSQVSQHLTVLKAVGLVEVEPRAQQRLYRLRAQPVKQLHKWLDRYRCIWEERFEQLDELVEEIKRKEKSDAAGKR
jgi:DNA-binding transcriptional ArsR family regulator